MAVGPTATTADNILNALGNATNWTAPTAFYVQLHTADPGAAGTTAVATETDRVNASMGTPSGSPTRTISNDAQLQWTAVAGSEDYTHWSAWTASSGGTFLFSGTVTANAVTAGDTFTIPIGDLDITLPIAA
jgi:hypothetical protein